MPARRGRARLCAIPCADPGETASAPSRSPNSYAWPSAALPTFARLVARTTGSGPAVVKPAANGTASSESRDPAPRRAGASTASAIELTQLTARPAGAAPPVSPSWTACSAADSCPVRWCCSAAIRALASPPWCSTLRRAWPLPLPLPLFRRRECRLRYTCARSALGWTARPCSSTPTPMSMALSPRPRACVPA